MQFAPVNEKVPPPTWRRSMKNASTILFLVLLLCFSCAAGAANPAMPPALEKVATDLTAVLGMVDDELSRGAARLGDPALKEADVRNILRMLCEGKPYAADCARVDRSGVMAIIEPEVYRRFEGSDISRQEQVIELQRSVKPVFSRAFRTVEGIDAVDFEYPVFSPQKDFLGSVSLLIRPEVLLARLIAPLAKKFPMDIWVMQPDGRILYDADKDQTGRMLFDDRMFQPFPSLLALGKRIAAEKTGSGTYEFMGRRWKNLVTKQAHWMTVSFHGAEWRLIAVQAVSSFAGPPPVASQPADPALRELATQQDFQHALSAGNEVKALRFFDKFHATYRDVYSIQWVDAIGVNRFGYPEEASLRNYDYSSMQTPSSAAFLKAVIEKKETRFTVPLIEGDVGDIYAVPVYRGGTYLGMIYTIQRRP
jgi:hypothetical protein